MHSRDFILVVRQHLQGHKTKTGGTFGNNSLQNIVRNEKYTGVYIFNKLMAKDVDGKRNGNAYKETEEIIRVEDAVPVIIAKEEFEITQQKIISRKHTRVANNAKEVYLLSGKIVCGEYGKYQLSKNSEIIKKREGINKRITEIKKEIENLLVLASKVASESLAKRLSELEDEKIVLELEYDNFCKDSRITEITIEKLRGSFMQARGLLADHVHVSFNFHPDLVPPLPGNRFKENGCELQEIDIESPENGNCGVNLSLEVGGFAELRGGEKTLSASTKMESKSHLLI